MDTVDDFRGRIAHAVRTREPVAQAAQKPSAWHPLCAALSVGVPFDRAGAVDTVHEDRSDLVHRSPSVSSREQREWMPGPRTADAR
jgi:hypothetical protein